VESRAIPEISNRGVVSAGPSGPLEVQDVEVPATVAMSPVFKLTRWIKQEKSPPM
jgi:hypothetical protein